MDRMGRGTGFALRTAVVTFALAAAALPSAAAQAQTTPPDGIGLLASIEHTGVVDLGLFGPPGSRVRFTERVGGSDRPLGDGVVGDDHFAPLLGAVTWRCDRRSRHFDAGVLRPDGPLATSAAEIRTPSCARRLSVAVPRHVSRRGLVTVRIVDRWRLGDRRVRLCASGAGARGPCRLVGLSRSANGVRRRIRVSRSGILKVTVRLDAHRTVQKVGAGSAPAQANASAPAVLATGDSTIEGIDSFLGDRLGSTARTRSASRPGTGLSKASFDGEAWPAAARSQVSRFKPRITVMLLGANDGFPMQTADGAQVTCCEDPWVAEYALRARSLMRTYTRSRGHVLWLLLPTPRDDAKASIVAQVNRAVTAASDGLKDVRVLDLGPRLSPGGRYAEQVRRDGRDVTVRADDGLHLTNAGAAIAADLAAAEIRRTGWLDAP